MKIGAVSLGWAGKPLPQALEELAAMGGECVEINGRPGVHDGLVLNAQTIPQVRAWAAAAGLTISAVSGYNDFAQTDPEALAREVERLLTSCRAAADLGVPIVRAFAGDVKPGLSLETTWQALVTGLQQAAQQAEPLGITLAVENHGRLLNDGPTLARLVRETGAANVGVTLDSGNFCWAGHTPAQAQADFEAVLPHIVNVHIKDGIWQGWGEGRQAPITFVPAGEGDLPLASWIATLVQRGYRGAVCSEYEGAGEFAAGTRRSIANLLAWRAAAR